MFKTTITIHMPANHDDAVRLAALMEDIGYCQVDTRLGTVYVFSGPREKLNRVPFDLLLIFGCTQIIIA